MSNEEVRRLDEEQSSALIGYACALLGVRASAEDVVHAVFLKLIYETNLLPIPCHMFFEQSGMRPSMSDGKKSDT